MKKIFNESAQSNQVVTEESYEETLVIIIKQVIEKRKNIHDGYSLLMRSLYDSSRPIRSKTLLSKYLLTRLLRESDRAFNEAKLLAKKLCPKCKKDFSNYENISEKLH